MRVDILPRYSGVNDRVRAARTSREIVGTIVSRSVPVRQLTQFRDVCIAHADMAQEGPKAAFEIASGHMRVDDIGQVGLGRERIQRRLIENDAVDALQARCGAERQQCAVGVGEDIERLADMRHHCDDVVELAFDAVEAAAVGAVATCAAIHQDQLPTFGKGACGEKPALAARGRAMDGEQRLALADPLDRNRCAVGARDFFKAH